MDDEVYWWVTDVKTGRHVGAWGADFVGAAEDAADVLLTPRWERQELTVEVEAQLNPDHRARMVVAVWVEMVEGDDGEGDGVIVVVRARPAPEPAPAPVPEEQLALWRDA
jgi:hypothetical protein